VAAFDCRSSGAIAIRELGPASPSSMAQRAHYAINTVASSKCGHCLIFNPSLAALDSEVQPSQAGTNISMA
jgi:hypothetical protein